MTYRNIVTGLSCALGLALSASPAFAIHPTAFDLISPADGDSARVNSNAHVHVWWHHSVDPDGRSITYTFQLSTNATFGTVAFSAMSSDTSLDFSAGRSHRSSTARTSGASSRRTPMTRSPTRTRRG